MRSGTVTESPPTLRFRQAGEGSWGLWRGAETLFTLLVTRGGGAAAAGGRVAVGLPGRAPAAAAAAAGGDCARGALRVRGG